MSADLEGETKAVSDNPTAAAIFCFCSALDCSAFKGADYWDFNFHVMFLGWLVSPDSFNGRFLEQTDKTGL